MVQARLDQPAPEAKVLASDPAKNYSQHRIGAKNIRHIQIGSIFEPLVLQNLKRHRAARDEIEKRRRDNRVKVLPLL